MVELRQRVMAVAATNATVLVEGESGLGKGFFVHAVHACSQRSDAPIVTLNCATISQPLIEAELFGPGQQLGQGGRRHSLPSICRRSAPSGGKRG